MGYFVCLAHTSAWRKKHTNLIYWVRGEQGGHTSHPLPPHPSFLWMVGKSLCNVIFQLYSYLLSLECFGWRFQSPMKDKRYIILAIGVLSFLLPFDILQHVSLIGWLPFAGVQKVNYRILIIFLGGSVPYPALKTLTLFQTKIYDFPYPIANLMLKMYILLQTLWGTVILATPNKMYSDTIRNTLMPQTMHSHSVIHWWQQDIPI